MIDHLPANHADFSPELKALFLRDCLQMPLYHIAKDTIYDDWISTVEHYLDLKMPDEDMQIAKPLLDNESSYALNMVHIYRVLCSKCRKNLRVCRVKAPYILKHLEERLRHYETLCKSGAN